MGDKEKRFIRDIKEMKSLEYEKNDRSVDFVTQRVFCLLKFWWLKDENDIEHLLIISGPLYKQRAGVRFVKTCSNRTHREDNEGLFVNFSLPNRINACSAALIKLSGEKSDSKTKGEDQSEIMKIRLKPQLPASNQVPPDDDLSDATIVHGGHPSLFPTKGYCQSPG